MNSEYLFKMALGIKFSWEITDIKFENLQSDKELNINIDFKKGSKFPDETGALTHATCTYYHHVGQLV